MTSKGKWDTFQFSVTFEGGGGWGPLILRPDWQGKDIGQQMINGIRLSTGLKLSPYLLHSHTAKHLKIDAGSPSCSGSPPITLGSLQLLSWHLPDISIIPRMHCAASICFFSWLRGIYFQGRLQTSVQVHASVDGVALPDSPFFILSAPQFSARSESAVSLLRSLLRVHQQRAGHPRDHSCPCGQDLGLFPL